MMEQVLLYMAGLPTFIAYFLIGIVMMLCYTLLYNLFTPIDEWQLIKQNDAAASLGFAGSILGFVLPLAAAIHNAQSALDCVLWGVVALIVQLSAFFAVRLFLPGLPERIRNGEVAAGILLAVISISVGLLNAASMTY